VIDWLDEVIRLGACTPAGRALLRVTRPRRPRFVCPVCGYHGPFLTARPAGRPRPHAQCPGCSAMERHRLQFLVLSGLQRSRDLSTMRMLHFAPERFFRGWFKGQVGRYETADLGRRDVDHRVDLTALPFADGTYDLVYASHVLEHIRDDEAALREIRRVLRPGGLAVLPVPIVNPVTVEYPAPNPWEAGHVRAPGLDYFDRYRRHFTAVQVHGSRDFPEHHQLFIHEDRSAPSVRMPHRTPMPGARHDDHVPVCQA
jgi:predicted SAM-dependent methyltransferase